MLDNEATLVIGYGEIGKALSEVLGTYYNVYKKDKDDVTVNFPKFKVINICYPYSPKFVEITKQYIKEFKPELTIIHSTVPPGTTRKLGKGVVHSPVNGRHPNISPAIKTFVKFVGGIDTDDVFRAVLFLNLAKINTHVFSSPESTELAKILCTTYYGWNLIFLNEVKRISKEYGVPFHEIYTEWNNAYNNAYSLMGENRFIRPVLFPIPGPIGGHCVIPNCELLDDFLTKTVKERNETYKPKEVSNESRKGNKNLE